MDATGQGPRVVEQGSEVGRNHTSTTINVTTRQLQILNSQVPPDASISATEISLEIMLIARP